MGTLYKDTLNLGEGQSDSSRAFELEPNSETVKKYRPVLKTMSGKEIFLQFQQTSLDSFATSFYKFAIRSDVGHHFPAWSAFALHHEEWTRVMHASWIRLRLPVLIGFAIAGLISTETTIDASIINSQPITSEQGFDNYTVPGDSLPTGWSAVTTGSSGVYNPFVTPGQPYDATVQPYGFDAQSGPETSYAGFSWAAGYDGTSWSFINTWLLSDSQTLNNGDVVSFWAREQSTASTPNRLEVRLSTNGDSAYIGQSGDPNGVGDFNTLLTSINPTLIADGFPDKWTQFTATVSGLNGPTTGRIGFRYNLSNQELVGGSGGYIGVDTFSINPTVVPEPATIVIYGLGFTGLIYRQLRKRKTLV